MTLLPTVLSHEDWTHFFSLFNIILCLLIALPISLVASIYCRSSNLPHANPPKAFGLRITKHIEFFYQGIDLIISSPKRFMGKPYRMLTTLGEVIVLPPHFAELVRNETRLNFRKAIGQDTQAHLSGFEAFALIDHPEELVQNMVKKHLSSHLHSLTAPMTSEATFAVNEIFCPSPNWETVNLEHSMSNLIARLSSRVFVGEELCRDNEWIAITLAYSKDVLTSSLKMVMIPGFLKPLWSIFSPDHKTVRGQLNRAREILASVLAKRRWLREQSRLNGEPTPQFNDILERTELEYPGKSYDPACFQLVLSFAAIHTSADLLCQTMLCLARDPAQLLPLREEIVHVLSKEGWKKTALYNLKLLDSAIKEAQRIKPNERLQLRRLAVDDVTLADNVKICKGERVHVDMTPMWDPSAYPNPETYDMYRFWRMRQKSNKANSAQLVSTSADFLPFGYGKYACPGRFFAANEIKIALCHLLLKYDWELAPGTNTDPFCFGHFMLINPEAKLKFRRRKEELDLDCLNND